MMYKQFAVGLLSLFGASASHAAALMGFEDSAMLMSEANRYSQELMVNYSPVLGHAFGVEVMRMSGRKQPEMTVVGANYTGLIKRWNLPAAQANLWFMGGVGEAHGSDSGIVYSPSLQFDAESTRWYGLAKVRFIRGNGINFDTAAVQGGFSFYEAGFDDTQPWLVLEAKTIRNLNPNVQVTPALRLINKNYFLEIGVTNPFQADATPRVNLMLTF